MTNNSQNIKEEVFKLEDIKTLVESLRVEANETMALVFDLEAHAQRLLTSIVELGFQLPANFTQENFAFSLSHQIKNKLQYFFNKQISFALSEYQAKKRLCLSDDVYKLRIIYQSAGDFDIEIEKYKRDLNKTLKVKILGKKEFHIDSSNPIWKHKFLPRPDFSYYLNQGFDEVIWTDENDNICEGSFTSIIYDDNKSPKANTLPSTSLLHFQDLEFVETKKDELPEDFYLSNSVMGITNATH